MQANLGSHGRWRLLLLLALALLIAAAWFQAPAQTVKTIPGGASRVAIAKYVRDRVTVIALDPATGQSHEVVSLTKGHDPTSLHVVRHGTAVAWIQGDKLWVMTLDAPYRQRWWPIPNTAGRSTIVGISSDFRFAVFQESTVWTARPYLLQVVNLTNGQVAFTLEPKCLVESTTEPDQFHSAPFTTKSAMHYELLHNSKPVDTFWELTESGQFKPFDSKTVPPIFRDELILVASSPEGILRRLAENEQPTPTDGLGLGDVVGVLPADRLFLRERDSNQVLIGNSASNELHRAGWRLESPEINFLTDDVAAIVTAWNDVEVIDLKTSKITAAFRLGTDRKQWQVALAIVTILFVVAWTWLGACEKSDWWLFDTATAVAIIPLAPLLWFAARFSIWHPPGPAGPLGLLIEHLAFVAGTITGTSIVAGWYWAYGYGRTLIRWSSGGLWLSVLSMFLSQTVLNTGLGLDETYLPYVDVIWCFSQVASIVVAGVSAISLLVPRPFGWSVRDTPSKAPLNRFGLSSIFVAMLGISAVFALVSATPISSHLDAMPYILPPALAAVGIGNVIASLIISRSRWTMAYHVAIQICLVPLYFVAAARLLMPLGWSQLSTITSVFLAATILPVVIASSLARCHGWRWMQSTAPPGSTTEEETAREERVDVPQSSVA
jgi:hypothetical protein